MYTLGACLLTDVCQHQLCEVKASMCFAVLQPYVPVFWYPWGQPAKMEAAMSSRRSLNPHVQAALRQGQNGKAAAPMNGGNGETVV